MSRQGHGIAEIVMEDIPMRHLIISVALAASAFAFPAWAAGGHGGGGMHGGAGMSAGMNGHGAIGAHGSLVSRTAHAAQGSGMKVGPQVSAVAHSNSHASAHMRKDNHGSLVSQTAHTAHTSGMKVGPQVRTVARSKSQGSAHANQHAIDAVNGTHGKAGSNSVLGTQTSSSANSASGKAQKHK
jgi:hypothetical protein